jgi:hypothetical protein
MADTQKRRARRQFTDEFKANEALPQTVEHVEE